ncbi:MAG: hypothetical protein E6I37_09975 [Chloroflexi bacterium]|nr:MAG: hypothetical protein E6I37_09975 [Chloroflexota bacterium]
MTTKNIVQVTDQNFETTVGASTQLVLVDFWATWAELAAGKSLGTLLNIEARPDAASHILFGTNVPTNLFLFFNTVR